jgi:hypothetical protein
VLVVYLLAVTFSIQFGEGILRALVVIRPPWCT